MDAKWYSFGVVRDGNGWKGNLFQVNLVSKDDGVLIDPITELTPRTWWAETQEEALTLFVEKDLGKLLAKGHHVIIAGFGYEE